MNGKPRNNLPPHSLGQASSELDRTRARNAATKAAIILERSPGGYVLSCPWLPEWRYSVRVVHDFPRAIQSLFCEIEVASYARWKGQRPDIKGISATDSFDEPLNRLGTVASPVLPPRKGHRSAGSWGTGGAREQDPADYTANSDGSWTSPKGKRFTSENMIRKIIRRRLAAGLPIEPEDCTYDLTVVRDTILRAAGRDDLPPHAWLVAAVNNYAQPPRRRVKRLDPQQMQLGIDLDDPEPAPGAKPQRHLRVVA